MQFVDNGAINMKDNARQFVVLAVLTASVLLVGCVTLETPDTKYVMKKDGFEEVGKPAVQKSEEAEQPVVTESSSKTSGDVQPQKSDDWTPNKEGAWGFCCQQGRGREPAPMGSFEFKYPLDVDTTYLRLKQEFGFHSREDYAKNPFSQNWMDEKRLLHLRYEGTPGVHYKMRNWVNHPYGNEESSNTIEVELFKDGANQVKIKIAYYSGNTLDAKGYASSIRQRIERALEGS